MRPSTLIARLVVSSLVLFLAGNAAAQATPSHKEGECRVEPGTGPDTDPKVSRDITNYNLEKGKPAIEGYDPVAYFPEGGGKALKGVKEHEYTYRGVTYRFANHENHQRFVDDPKKYEPAYGGWCASAIADGGRKVEIDPKNFKVTEGRLFLFYKGLFQDAKDYWVKDEAGNTVKADDWWKKIAQEEARKPGKKEGAEKDAAPKNK